MKDWIGELGSFPATYRLHVQGVYLYIKLPHATERVDMLLSNGPFGEANFLLYFIIHDEYHPAKLLNSHSMTLTRKWESSANYVFPCVNVLNAK